MRSLSLSVRSFTFIAAVWLAFDAAATWAEDKPPAAVFPVKARASADKDAIKIGERLVYTIHIEADGTAVPVIPDVPEKLGEFTVLDVKRGTPVVSAEGKTTATVTCLVTTYELGKQLIPATDIQYKLKDGAIGTITTKNVMIDVESVVPPKEPMKDIRDIREIITFRRTPPRVPPPPEKAVSMAAAWVAAIAVLVLLVLLVIIFRRRPARPLTVAEIALAELEKLRRSGLIAEGRVREFHYRLGDIVRRYMEKRFGLRAPERTTEEFVLELSGTEVLVPTQKWLLKHFFKRCDLAKYVRFAPPRTEIDASLSAVEKFIHETEPSPETADAGHPSARAPREKAP